MNQLYLSNLKTATPYAVKLTQIDQLLVAAARGEVDRFYTAMHFSNILKVSAFFQVRKRAGQALMTVYKSLDLGQKNDIVIELLRSLEIEGYRYTLLIPRFLGQLVAQLPDVEFYEAVDDFGNKVKSSTPQVAQLVIRAVGVVMTHLLQANDLNDAVDKRLKALLTVIYNGLYHYRHTIVEQAIRVLANDVFACDQLSLDDKAHVFQLMAKKFIVAIATSSTAVETVLNKTNALDAIVRFIHHFQQRAELCVSLPTNVAFFPGSFDPFSQAHLTCAKQIRDLGFAVYLAVDEFSWSKRTQPNLVRRKIVEMSTADQYNIYVMPSRYVVNIANPSNLHDLRHWFGDRKVFLVMGSDVLTGASAYRRADIKQVITQFSHIVFERAPGMGNAIDSERLEAVIADIKGDVIRLTLSREVESISSTQIRTFIDQRRDISELTERTAQQYIYDRALYRYEPLFKDTLTVHSSDVQVVESFDGTEIEEVCQHFALDPLAFRAMLGSRIYENATRLLIIRDIKRDNKIIAFSLFHWLRSSMIYHEFASDQLSGVIRDQAVGRIVVIDAMMCKPSQHFKKLEQVILTETLAFTLAKDYTFAIYKDTLQTANQTIEKTLALQGFIHYSDAVNQSIYYVNMTEPITLNLDCKAMLKAPYRDSDVVDHAISLARLGLQEALCAIRPGHLVLSFDRTMMYEHLIKKICDANGVPTVEQVPRQLGDNMVVTYGNLFKRWRIPNTVTKALHTERFYESDFKHYHVHEHPDYLPLAYQAKTIQSFNRPVILIDDLIDKGSRLKAILGIFNHYDIPIKQLVLATLTGRGRAWLEMNEFDAQSVYYIPKVKYWFNEAMLYPFIGGDAVASDRQVVHKSLQSLNLIMPYMYPGFLKDIKRGQIEMLSLACLNSASIVLTALERAYRERQGRELTIKLLSDVIISPRIPYKSDYFDYNVNSRPSNAVLADMEYLRKITSV